MPRIDEDIAKSPPPERPVRLPAGSRAAPRDKASPFAVTFVLSLVVPLILFVGNVRASPYLVLLVVSFFPLVFMWLSGRVGPVSLPDCLMLGATLWAALALMVNHGVVPMIEPSGIVLLETFGSYLVGRCLVRGPQGMLTIGRVYIVALVAMLPFAIIEAVTTRSLWLQMFSFVGPVYLPVNAGERLGLWRSQVGFEHPILFGLYVSSLFAFLLTTRKTSSGKFLCTILSGILTFVSLSTGALLCFMVQTIMLFWSFLIKHRNKWKIFISGVVFIYILIDVLSNRTPFHVFVSYLTFNSSSSYYRILIWRYGSENVAANPIFGIGMNDWVRPEWMISSVDMFWLLFAMQYGLPGACMLAAAILLILFRAGRPRNLPEITAQIRRGLIISIVALIVALWSVALWRVSYCWFFFLVGCAHWLTELETRPRQTQDPVNPTDPVEQSQRPRAWL